MNGDLVPKVDPGEIARHRPMDYGTRFLFGAAISLAAGLIGMKFGPVVGGVFLGFPAILPASLTLIEKKEGRRQAAIDSEGAILGAIALVVYAVVVVLMVTRVGVVAGLIVAMAAWLAVAVVLYFAFALGFRREPAPP